MTRGLVKGMVGVLVALMLGHGAAARQQKATSVDVLMGEALHQEEVEGNVEAAIATYRKVIADRGAPRTLAATALLRVGRAYEKLGNAEARKAHERLTREYADLTQIVSEAKARLAALGAPGSDENHVVARQIWVGDEANIEGLPSQDGNLLAFVDRTSTDGGNLAIRNLATGETRRLTNGTTVLDGFPGGPALSPDGTQIAFVWYPEGDEGPSIRLMNVDGTRTRVLHQQKGESPSDLRWSPDGRHLAAQIWHPGTDKEIRLVLIAASDGSLTELKSLGPVEVGLAGFSKDGRFLAYTKPGTAAGSRGGVFTLALDSRAETRIVDGQARDYGPAWTADGKAIVFLSDRSGTQDLWAVRVTDGKAAGEPERIRPNMGGQVRTMGFSRDGSFLYGVQNAISDIYVADIDPRTLRVAAAPRRLSGALVGTNSGPAWSPDGRFLAFLRGSDRRAQTVVVHSLADGTERALPLKFTDSIFAASMGPTWLPDSRSLMVPDMDFANKRVIIRRVWIDTGADDVVFERSGDMGMWPLVRVSPDGRSLFYTARTAAANPELHVLHLMSRDVDTGAETELYRAESSGIGLFGLAVSPDGRRLAFSVNTGPNARSLLVLPVEGGAPQVLHQGNYSDPQPSGVGWTNDGRHVLAVARDGNRRAGVWAYPVAGGDRAKLDITMRRIGALCVSPDGSRLAFASGRTNAELWTVKNLMAPESPARSAK